MRGSRPRRAPRTAAGRKGRDNVDLRPLKWLMREHVRRLSKARPSDERARAAMKILRQAQMALTSECLPTMVIEIP